MEIIIATRKSKLAQVQADYIGNLLKKENNLDYKKLLVVTEGDRRLDVTLNKIGGKGLFTKEVEFVCTEIEEKLKVPDLLGKTVKVTEKQFPEVYKILVKQAKIAEIEIPDTFVYEDFYYGVESKGTTKPWIEISAKTIQDLKSEEIEFLISREMYNIKNGITYYRSIFEQLIKVIESGSWIVGVDTLIKTMKLKMCHWNRLTHFSADCYGYLMNKNIVICINSILKLVLNT